MKAAPENRLSAAQVTTAVEALLKHLQAQKASAGGRKRLLADDDAVSIYMTLHLKKIPGRASNKPLRM